MLRISVIVMSSLPNFESWWPCSEFDKYDMREWKGDILYVADCEGQGHITRIIEPITAAVISGVDHNN